MLLSLCTGGSAGALSIEELPPAAEYALTAVRIEGAHGVSARSVRGVMLSRVHPWYTPWRRWLDPVAFNAAILRTDLERVDTLLRESGYYTAQVTYELVPDDTGLAIVLHIEEGPPTRVADVAVTVTDVDLTAEDDAALRGLLALRQGDVFTQEAYDHSRAELERWYLERGFAYVDVAKAAVVDIATQQAAVTYTITRGIPAVFGATTVSGQEALPDTMMLRELAYRPGEAYDPRKLATTQARIFGLGLFRSVTVEPANLDERSGTVEVLIQVAEGPPRSLKLGVGYGLEDELRAQVQWQHNNFLGDGRRLGVQLKGSLITQSIEGEFRQPHFLHPRQTFVLPLSERREDEPGYTLLQTRLAPRIERRLLPELTASIGYTIEYDDLSGVSEETKQRLDEFQARGVLSGVTATIERNTAGDLLDPRTGSVLTLTVEQAGGPWGGAFTLYRGLFEAKTYLPAWLHDQVLALRFRLGAGDGFGGSKDLPMFRRFYAGGIASTRGYDRFKLGPLTSNEKPIGGRSLIEGNMELRTPVYAGFGAVVFVDAGRVDLDPWRYDLGHLQYSTGPGIRYQTPIGPLRLDFGFPLNAPDGLPSWQIHFSIGQAF